MLVTEGEPVHIDGLPEGVSAFRLPGGIHLWDGKRHIPCGQSAEHLEHALFSLHAARMVAKRADTMAVYGLPSAKAVSEGRVYGAWPPKGD